MTTPLVGQFIRSATSIGAKNYSEANDAESKKDFRHKIGVCRKGSRRDQKHWLRMIVATRSRTHRDEAAKLWQEAKELNLIFSTIFRNAKPR